MIPAVSGQFIQKECMRGCFLFFSVRSAGILPRPDDALLPHAENRKRLSPPVSVCADRFTNPEACGQANAAGNAALTSALPVRSGAIRFFQPQTSIHRI